MRAPGDVGRVTSHSGRCTITGTHSQCQLRKISTKGRNRPVLLQVRRPTSRSLRTFKMDSHFREAPLGNGRGGPANDGQPGGERGSEKKHGKMGRAPTADE